jgi:hypothetical protein
MPVFVETLARLAKEPSKRCPAESSVVKDIAQKFPISSSARPTKTPVENGQSSTVEHVI